MKSIYRILSATIIPAVIFFTLSCDGNHVKQSDTTATVGNTTGNNYTSILQDKENIAANRKRDNQGELLATIHFRVKTDNKTDYPDGYIPWASIEKADEDVPKLADRDKVVINNDKVTLVIDYPLTSEYHTELESPGGFTTGELLAAVRQHYLMAYDEEEKTATVKTIAREKRTGLINRNQTNGKYGIWGHDIADLVLSEVTVYRTAEGRIILSLGIES